MVGDHLLPRTELLPKYHEKYNLVLICNEIDTLIKRIACRN